MTESIARPEFLVSHPVWEEYCDSNQLTFRLLRFDDPLFSQVLELRKSVYNVGELSQPDTFDPYSEHYVALIQQQPAAALRVTRKAIGPVECEAHFPESVMRAMGDVIGSASRFVALPSIQANTKVAKVLIEVAWMHQVTIGTRLDVMNVHERAVKYYGRLAYELVADSFFWHPKWKTPSHVMVLPVTPNRDSRMRHVFADVKDPLEIDELEKLVRFQPWKEFQRRAMNDLQPASATDDVVGAG
jgi:hypothetical protein